MNPDIRRAQLVERLQIIKNQLDYGIMVPMDFDIEERRIIRELKQINNGQWSAVMVGEY